MTNEQLTNFLDKPDVRVKVDGLVVIVCDKQRRWEGQGTTVAEAAEIAIEEERKYRAGFSGLVAKDLGKFVAAGAIIRTEGGRVIITPTHEEDVEVIRQLLLATADFAKKVTEDAS